MDITANENTHNNKSKTYKIIGLAIVSLILQGIMWWTMGAALYDGKPLEFWLLPIVMGALWIVAFSFFIISTGNKHFLNAVSAASLIIYFTILPKDVFVWIGGLIFTALVVAYEYRIKSVEKNQSHFSIRFLLSGSILILTNALLVALGFNIYHNTSQDFKQNPGLFYDRVSQSVVRNLPQVSQGLPERFELSQTLDQFIVRQFEEQSEDFQASDPRAQNLIADYRDQFLRQYNLRGDGDDSLASILTLSVMERFKESASRYNKLFPLIFTIIILGLLRTFAFIFNWFTMLLGWFVLKILLTVKFFQVYKVQVEVDKLEI